MSRTATCFWALGICVAMAAACGDDDGDGNGGGGSGGQGASGGTAGAGGSGGASGSAGAAGSNAMGGDAGQPNGGAAGSTAGTAGSSSGSSGSAGSSSGASGSGGEPPDAGPDGSVETDASVDPPDSGGPVLPVDSGVNGDCVGFTTGVLTIDPPAGQDVVIARVIFNNDDETATVVLRVINAFAFGGDQVICWGATNSECVSADDNVAGERAVGTEVPIVVGTTGDPIDDAAGELFFASEVPENNPADIFAYANWGEHASAVVVGIVGTPTLEALADTANRWTTGDSIVIDGGDNAFFGNGDTQVETGFDSCNADQF